MRDVCKYCGLPLHKAACAAILIDLGCRTNIDPINCHASPDKKHDFTGE